MGFAFTILPVWVILAVTIDDSEHFQCLCVIDSILLLNPVNCVISQWLMTHCAISSQALR